MFKCGDEMNIQDFINEISDRLINDESGITFFIGTGFSMWYGYPSWKGLLKSYCKKVYAESERRKLKLSTLHSFKGWEIHTLFLIIDGNVQTFKRKKYIHQLMQIGLILFLPIGRAFIMENNMILLLEQLPMILYIVCLVYMKQDS